MQSYLSLGCLRTLQLHFHRALVPQLLRTGCQLAAQALHLHSSSALQPQPVHLHRHGTQATGDQRDRVSHSPSGVLHDAGRLNQRRNACKNVKSPKLARRSLLTLKQKLTCRESSQARKYTCTQACAHACTNACTQEGLITHAHTQRDADM